jgi:ATP-dependent DNA helicase DinG
VEKIPFEKIQEFQKKLFEHILPRHGFAPREKQIELADEILCAMRRLDVMFAEAEVGTGKTLAYLLPAVLIRRGRVNEVRASVPFVGGHPAPIVIATSGIALQRAIVRDYIPALSDILMEHKIIRTPLTAALRKGKSNYVCDHRLVHFLDHANQQTRDAAEPLVKRNIVDLSAVRELTPYIRRNVCVDRHCGRECPRHTRCRYTMHIKTVNQGGYDFQVVNHNFFLADLIHRSNGKQPLIPEYQAVVIDEAHKFLNAARDMYGSELSLTEFNGLPRDIRGFTFAPGQSTADIILETDRLQSKGNLLFQFLNKEIPEGQRGNDETERYATKIRERTEKLVRVLKTGAGALKELLEDRVVMRNYENRRQSALRSLTRTIAALDAFIRHRELVYWLEERPVSAARPERDGCGGNILRGIPKDLGKLLHRDLWSQNIPIILTSGTLSAAGSFSHMKKKLGLDCVPAGRVTETSKPSPFDHKKNALIYISEKTTFPNVENEGYIESVVSEVERLVAASHGHAAVLFTSYKAMELVYEKIMARRLPFPLFRLNRGGASVIERFKRGGNGVLFASGALWEGIDIPGDILSMLIIVRLPFAVPDPVSEWEKTLYTDMDEYKARVVVPEMLIKLKQGFGRLIRTETDTGACAILDCRANVMGAYRGRVLNALPPCRVTSDIHSIDPFLRERKPEAYYMAPLLKAA